MPDFSRMSMSMGQAVAACGLRTRKHKMQQQCVVCVCSFPELHFQLRKPLQYTATGPQFVAMPRVAARQLVALAAAARMPAASYAQPAASLWSSAFSPTGCSQSCTCSRCATSGRQHGLSCGCSSCRTTVLGVPAVPSGRMHLATLGDSQDKVGCTLLNPTTEACLHPATLTRH